MYDKIQAALDQNLSGIDGLPTIAWENVQYEPVKGTPWIRTKFMPLDRSIRSIGIDSSGKPYQQRYTGIYQLNIAVPENTGTGPINDIFNKIVGVFEASLDLTNEDEDVYVTIRRIEEMRAYQESPWYKRPVNIYWYSYAK